MKVAGERTKDASDAFCGLTSHPWVSGVTFDDVSSLAFGLDGSRLYVLSDKSARGTHLFCWGTMCYELDYEFLI